jgi:hypothetical protein
MASAATFQHPGGIVTAAQIQQARNALAAGKEPWKSAWAEVLERAEQGLYETPSAVVNFYVPGYYEDAAGHDAAKKRLRDDVNAAYACALVRQIGFKLDAATRARHGAKARELIGAWARINRAVSGSDGRLVMAYVGTALVTVAELLADDPAWSATDRAYFTRWTNVVLVDVATIESNGNNLGSWGVFAGLAGAYWRSDVQAIAQHAARLRALIDSQIDDSGNLPLELSRGAKGLWYTYFSLAPLTHAAGILRNASGENLLRWQPPSGGSLERALDRFYALAQNPGSMDPPLPHNWGGDLLFAMGTYYGESSWTAWADPPFSSSNSAWKTPDLLHLPEPSRAAGLVAGAAGLAILARCRSVRGGSDRRTSSASRRCR